jgi:hypothetical protein
MTRMRWGNEGGSGYGTPIREKSEYQKRHSDWTEVFLQFYQKHHREPTAVEHIRYLFALRLRRTGARKPSLKYTDILKQTITDYVETYPDVSRGKARALIEGDSASPRAWTYIP